MSSGSCPRSSRRSRVGTSRGESWRVGSGQDPAERYAVAIRHARTFHALFAAIDRRAPGDFPAAGGFGDGAVDGDLVKQQPDEPVVGLERDLFQANEGAELDPLVAAVVDGEGRSAMMAGRAQISPVIAKRLNSVITEARARPVPESFPRRLSVPAARGQTNPHVASVKPPTMLCADVPLSGVRPPLPATGVWDRRVRG